MSYDVYERARLAIAHTRHNAQRVSDILRDTVETLERSATLAEEHARRRQGAEHPAGADREQDTARRTREAAQRARVSAEYLADRLGQGHATLQHAEGGS